MFKFAFVVAKYVKNLFATINLGVLNINVIVKEVCSGAKFGNLGLLELLEEKKNNQIYSLL